MYKLPREYLSASQINLYLLCPRKYRYAYVENLPRAANDRLVIGRAVSKGLEVYNLQGKTIDQNDLINIIKTEVDIYKEELSDDILNEASDIAAKCITTYIDYIHDTDLNNYLVLSAEERKETNIAGVNIVYVPDLIKSDLSTLGDAIVDYKTSTRHTYSPDVLKYDIQTSIYALAERIYDIEIHEIKKPTKKKPPEIIISKTTKTQQSLDDAIDVIENTAKAITADVFPKCDPKSWICSPAYCEYWDQCRGKSYD